jgi:hypothetical protein
MTGLMPPVAFLAIPQAQTCQAAKRRPIKPPCTAQWREPYRFQVIPCPATPDASPNRIFQSANRSAPPVEMMLFYRVRLMRRTDGPSPEACKYAAAAPAVT